MLGLSVIILFKSLLHVFCSLVFSAHNSSVDILLIPVVLEGVVVEKVESSHGDGGQLK